MLTHNDPDAVQRLKQACHYASWHNRNRLDGTLFVWHFAFTGRELPGWKPIRLQPLVSPTGPALHKSIWIPDTPASPRSLAVPAPGAALQPDPDAPLVQVDGFECASRASAHEFVLGLLGEFQIPGVTLQESCAAGDVAFSAPGSRVLLIARANLVFLVRSTGRAPAPVAELTLALDQGILTPPSPAPIAGRATTTATATAPAPSLKTQRGTPVPLPLGATAPAPGPAAAAAIATPSAKPTLKIFANLGEISVEENRLIYVPLRPGTDDVRVFASDPEGRSTVESLQIEVT